MSSTKPRTSGKKVQRATSNIFAMFVQSQIQEFKEAFNLIDNNKDGFIDREDLFAIFDSLGKLPRMAELDAMMAEVPGPLNFTMFLTLFGERISGMDPEDVIMKAFLMFDKEKLGKIDGNYIKDILSKWGEKLTPEEIEECFSEAPIDNRGKLDYGAFTRILTRGKDEEDII